MDKIVTKDQMQTILDTRPDGVSMDEMIDAYTKNGYQVEGINYTPPEPSFNSALTGTDRLSAQEKNIALLQGGADGSAISSGISSAIQNPVEFGKGVVKGIPRQSAELTQSIESLGKNALNLVGIDTSKMGLNYAPIQEMTAPSNQAQEAGVFASNFLPVSEPKTAYNATKGLVTKGIDVAPELANLVSTKLGNTKSAISTAMEKRSQDQFDNLVRAITQGKKTDIDKAKAAISSIDTKGIKTYADLANAYDNKVSEISSVMNKALEQEKRVLYPKDNPYIQDAINQLRDHYIKVNDRSAIDTINAIDGKFTTEGLSLLEINNLAKLHGYDLNAFSPVTGELSTGLSKQAAENTRAGLKDAIRSNATNPLYREADSELSNVMKARDTSEKMSERVNQAKQKIIEMNFGKKVGYYAGKAINALSFNSLKGIAEAITSRSKDFEGNPIDIEKMLASRLKKFESITSSGKSEEDIISKLNDFIKQTEAENKTMLALPSGAGKKPIPMSAPKSKSLTEAEKLSNEFTQNLRQAKNTKALPSPKTQILPNKRGTPNPLGRPYSPNEQGQVGGSSVKKTKLR